MTQLDGYQQDAADSVEREDGRLELVATVLLGLGAVLIAWGTYQSAWYDGQKARSSRIRSSQRRNQSTPFK